LPVPQPERGWGILPVIIFLCFLRLEDFFNLRRENLQNKPHLPKTPIPRADGFLFLAFIFNARSRKNKRLAWCPKPKAPPCISLAWPAAVWVRPARLGGARRQRVCWASSQVSSTWPLRILAGCKLVNCARAHYDTPKKKKKKKKKAKFRGDLKLNQGRSQRF
jgi:hypothetical protein